MEGFAAYDNAVELRKRVDELPPSLGIYFSTCSVKSRPRYQNEAARILRLCYRNQINHDPLSLVCFAIFQSSAMDPAKVLLTQGLFRCGEACQMRNI